MRAEFGVERDHENLGAEHASKGAVDAEIDDLLSIEAALFGEARGHPESDEKGERDEHAVGGQSEAANGYESGEHSLLF